MPELCPRCGRGKAEKMLTWNRERYAADDKYWDDENAVGEQPPQRTCARHITNRFGCPDQVAEWDCDRATIAKHEATIARLEALLVAGGQALAELRADVLALGKCQACGGNGVDGPDGDGFSLPCGACSGTGRDPRVAKWLP